jgi:hypothetical protein
MTISPATILRLIHDAPEPEPPTPRVLGVDEWAKRKGQCDGPFWLTWNGTVPWIYYRKLLQRPSPSGYGGTLGSRLSAGTGERSIYKDGPTEGALEDTPGC